MESCLYQGVVRHRRTSPREHSFERRIFMAYLDLDELDTVFRGRWLWSTSRLAVARFRREDHLGDPGVPLQHAVRDLVEERRGVRPGGPIRLLTHLRYWGYVFNPLSLFYCFDAAGERVESVVAEVSNTPWNERHVYVLTPEMDAPRGEVHRFRTAKEFHVSPFLGMDQDYSWNLREPGEHLSVVLRNQDREAGDLFDASLVLHRRPIRTASLCGVLLRYPWMTAQVMAGIYVEAARLRRKGVPVLPHPRERNRALEARTS